MSTIVYDAIHIEIQIVKLRYPVLRYKLRDCRIPLAHPAKEFRYTHDYNVDPAVGEVAVRSKNWPD